MKFIASPEPLPDESRASWIQRVCGAHGYSMKRFCDCVGVGSNRIDWDFGVAAAYWRALAADCGYSTYCFERNDRDWVFIKQLHPHPTTPLIIEGKPASKWCAACMVADATPYLRWYWRIAELRTCPYHDLELSTRCPWCQSYMNLSIANLVPWGRLMGAANLAGCASCGMPFLVDATTAPSKSLEREFSSHGSRDPVNAVRQALNRSALSKWETPRGASIALKAHSVDPVEPRTPLPCHMPSEPRPSVRGDKFCALSTRRADVIQAFSTSRAYGLLRLNNHWITPSTRKIFDFLVTQERERVLGADFMLTRVSRSIMPCKPARKTRFWTPGELTKWSALLTPPMRVRVAKALLIIRKEKALQRARALQGLDVDEEQIQIDSRTQLYRGT